jgi:hypothetical protein
VRERYLPLGILREKEGIWREEEREENEKNLLEK